MAIAMEFTHPNGARVIVRDDCCRGLDRDEIVRRRRELSRAILRIDRGIQTKEGKTHDESGDGGVQAADD